MFQACLDQKIDDVKRQIIAGSANLYNDTIFWERGWTPIRYAALAGSKLDKSDIHKYQMNMAKKIIGLLINADIKDNYNRMAYDYANTENMKSILKI